MKIAIFGASGGIGKFATKHALDKGYDVVAYVRNPSRLTISHDNLQIIKGEINDYLRVKTAINGCHAIIWCVGIAGKKYEEMPSLEGHQILLKAMKDCGVTRLVDWATPSLSFEKDRKSLITIAPVVLGKIFLKYGTEEVNKIGQLLSKSDIDWTIVRFLRPTNKAYTGNAKVSFGDVKIKFGISREDIGAFMVEQVESKKYSYSMPIIGG